jgi:hypothetical protein
VPAVISASSISRSTGPSLISTEILLAPGWIVWRATEPMHAPALAAVLAEPELEVATRGTLRRLSIDHPLDAIGRRRFHGRLRY